MVDAPSRPAITSVPCKLPTTQRQRTCIIVDSFQPEHAGGGVPWNGVGSATSRHSQKRASFGAEGANHIMRYDGDLRGWEGCNGMYYSSVKRSNGKADLAAAAAAEAARSPPPYRTHFLSSPDYRGHGVPNIVAAKRRHGVRASDSILLRRPASVSRLGGYPTMWSGCAAFAPCLVRSAALVCFLKPYLCLRAKIERCV